MEFLDKELNKICLNLEFSIDKINYIKTELSRRNAMRSLKGMPYNLLVSIYRKEIEYIREYGEIHS